MFVSVSSLVDRPNRLQGLGEVLRGNVNTFADSVTGTDESKSLGVTQKGEQEFGTGKLQHSNQAPVADNSVGLGQQTTAPVGHADDAGRLGQQTTTTGAGVAQNSTADGMPAV